MLRFVVFTNNKTFFFQKLTEIPNVELITSGVFFSGRLPLKNLMVFHSMNCNFFEVFYFSLNY